VHQWISVLSWLDTAKYKALLAGVIPSSHSELCLLLLRSGTPEYMPQEKLPEIPVIEVTTTPKNQKYFSRLMSFAREVLGVCDEVGIKPVLSASLAVFAYTQDPTMEVHDVDLSCSESHFPRLRQALEGRGVDCRITSWHVLQAVRDDLKVEFDATEHWMQDIPERHEIVKVGDVQFWMVGVDGLRELYRRGLVGTAGEVDDNNQIKHRAIREKLRSLGALRI
jgi:hypothetical protein